MLCRLVSPPSECAHGQEFIYTSGGAGGTDQKRRNFAILHDDLFIDGKQDLARAWAMATRPSLDELDLVGEDESHPLASMMEVVGVLVAKYEEEYVPELEDDNVA